MYCMSLKMLLKHGMYICSFVSSQTEAGPQRTISSIHDEVGM